jgi:hypothetical protein
VVVCASDIVGTMENWCCSRHKCSTCHIYCAFYWKPTGHDEQHGIWWEREQKIIQYHQKLLEKWTSNDRISTEIGCPGIMTILSHELAMTGPPAEVL